jgi:hypothetical protein
MESIAAALKHLTKSFYIPGQTLSENRDKFLEFNPDFENDKVFTARHPIIFSTVVNETKMKMTTKDR